MECRSGSARAEAERLLSIAEKLLVARDFVGSKNFAEHARQLDPHLPGIDLALVVSGVLLAAERRINSHMDWYAVLQMSSHSQDIDSMRKQYQQLARLLHPDHNRLSGADTAFELIVDAWAVLSNPARRARYDRELNIPLDLNKTMPPSNNSNPPTTPVHQESSGRGGEGIEDFRFWTSCPYCCNLYEYAEDYENCRLKCQKCKRGFQATAIKSLPAIVPGMDAYYCSWGFFPLGVWGPDSQPDGNNGESTGFSSWKPFFPMNASSFRTGRMGNGDSSEEGENREKADGSAGNGELIYSSNLPKERTNVEPLLAVPISMRAPRKKPAKKTKKEFILRTRAENIAKESEPEKWESCDSLFEDVEMGSSAGDPCTSSAAGIDCSQKAFTTQFPAEKVVGAEPLELHGVHAEADPVDIPSLLKLWGVKEEEMNAPCNDLGSWYK